MDQLTVRGVLGPLFIALGLAAGVLQFQLNSSNLLWLNLGFLALGLWFARDTRRLFLGALATVRADPPGR